jgi:hypothetical protein
MPEDDPSIGRIELVDDGVLLDVELQHAHLDVEVQQPVARRLDAGLDLGPRGRPVLLLGLAEADLPLPERELDLVHGLDLPAVRLEGLDDGVLDGLGAALVQAEDVQPGVRRRRARSKAERLLEGAEPGDAGAGFVERCTGAVTERV